MYEKKGSKESSKKAYLFFGLNSTTINLILLVILFILFIVALLVGPVYIDPVTGILIVVSGVMEGIGNLIAALFSVHIAFFYSIGHTWSYLPEVFIWNERFPEVLTAAIVGMGLSVSGAAFQGTFRNPLVSESILGVSAGAGAGAAIAMLLSMNLYMIQLFAFTGGLLAVAMAYMISRFCRGNPTLVLVMAGIIVGSVFGALTSIMRYEAASNSMLPAITFWLMGSFANISSIDQVYLVAPIILICIGVLFIIRWRLNVLSMGDEEARALGVDTKKLRLLVIVCATVITSAAVSITGMVGWVGLVIPQIARMLVGPDHKVMIPVSILLGGSFLIVVDILCRITGVYIPVSIVTSVIGTPFFLYLLIKTKESWS
jgi:iron complex transport system permease protein